MVAEKVTDRFCAEFNHLLGQFGTWDDLPACEACATIVRTEWKQEPQVTRGETPLVHLLCGMECGATLANGSGQFGAVLTYVDGRRAWRFIGNRSSKVAAITAVAASHECPEA